MSGVEGFAAIPNWIVRDKSVSLYAIAVYVALASHNGPGGIHPNRDTIAAEARCSVRQVARALVELETLGVVVRVRRTSSTGRAPSGYDLRPQGRLAPDEEFVEVGDSESPTPQVEDSSDMGSGLRVLDVPLTEEEPIKKPVTEYFDEFWQAYPRHMAKEAARKAFAKACRSAAAEVIIAGARRFAEDPNLPEKTFVPYPASWLNAGRWDDEPLPARDRPVGPRDLDDAEEWMRR